MTHDRDLDQQVRTWLDEPSPGPPDREAVFARVLDRLPGIHQRRHWWPIQWNPFAAGATRSADANGPRPQGRSRTMLNATRAVAIVAALALGASLAVVVEPFGPSSEPGAPSAEARSFEEIAKVKGSASLSVGESGVREMDGDVTHETGSSLTGSITTGDVRLDGPVEILYNVDHIGPAAGAVGKNTSVFAGDLTITNEGGSWHGRWRGAELPSVLESGELKTTRHQAVLSGSGSYEGLTALVYFHYPPGAASPEVEGVIFPGEFPAYPD